jgi:hypothetical protein
MAIHPRSADRPGCDVPLACHQVRLSAVTHAACAPDPQVRPQLRAPPAQPHGRRRQRTPAAAPCGRAADRVALPAPTSVRRQNNAPAGPGRQPGPAGRPALSAAQTCPFCVPEIALARAVVMAPNGGSARSRSRRQFGPREQRLRGRPGRERRGARDLLTEAHRGCPLQTYPSRHVRTSVCLAGGVLTFALQFAPATSAIVGDILCCELYFSGGSGGVTR